MHFVERSFVLSSSWRGFTIYVLQTIYDVSYHLCTFPPPTDHPVLNETCPRDQNKGVSPTSSTSTIVAAVVGGLIGLVLIVLIILLVVYYQVCRKGDPAEEGSRESAFDFSKTAQMAVNPKSNSSKGKNSKNLKADVAKGTAKENGNFDEVKEKTPPTDTTL